MSREKHLQRLMPAEDERKLQTKLFVKLRVWRSKDRNHRFMMVDFKNHAVSTEKSGLFCFITKEISLYHLSALCGIVEEHDRKLTRPVLDFSITRGKQLLDSKLVTLLYLIQAALSVPVLC